MLHFVHGTYFYLVNGNVYGYIIFRKMKALKKRWGNSECLENIA
ncbi:hypothetical protein MC28_2281 [Bacillus thuringiensis MC28]|nr:hypothetical protein MC28_2281 [Bacillus thuringiensis MC28]